MTALRERFGRPLRLGIIGGGPNSWIGRMHRTAAQMDGWFRVTAGVVSGDPAKARSAGVAVGLAPERSYADVAEMLKLECERTDRIDAVAIMTPNDTHYPYSAAALDAGFDVVCDKPVTHDFREASDLVERTRRNGRLFAIAHGYTAYPMTRHALQTDLKEIFARLGKTVVLVTHDMHEAAHFGHEIVLMREGRVVQRGTLEDLLARPAEPFVSEFVHAQRADPRLATV